MSSGLTERRSITAALPLGPSSGNYLEDSSLMFGPTSSIASIYVQRDHVKKVNSRRLLDLKYFEDTSEFSDSGDAGGARLERCLSSPNIPIVAPPSQETDDIPSSQPKGIQRQPSRRASLQSITFEYGSGDSSSRRTSLASLRLPPLQQKRMSGGSVGRHQIHPMAEMRCLLV